MRRFYPFLIAFALLALFVLSVQAQGGQGPVVDILGEPEAGPETVAYVSVTDPNVGRTMLDLGPENFEIQVSGDKVDVTSVATEATGVAVVAVIDRGGIARRGDPRIGRAVDLVSTLLISLTIDGSPNADMMGLIGIRGAEAGGLTPTVMLTDHDPNTLSNEFDRLRSEVVPEVTPLYDGIDRAIEWLIENPDTQIQEKLTHRRPVILVFSDGIDQKFSNEAYETLIINKCLDNGILLYAVRMGGGATDEDNLQAMATQTNGRYITHTPETNAETLAFLDDMISQRYSYRLAFPLLKPQNDYRARIRVVNTPIGDGSAETMVTSKLKTPKIVLNPPPETDLTVPYSRTLEGFEERSIPLSVQITYGDDMSRDPAEVAYYANGSVIGSSTSAPNYAIDWDVTGIVTPTDTAQTREFTIIARAIAVYLEAEMVSNAVTVRVTWEKEDLPLVEEIKETGRANWWIIAILIVLIVGLIVLLIMLIRTRGEVAKKMVSRTTGMIGKMTQRLGVAGPAHAKLVITHGSNMGQEYRLSGQITKVGREPQSCDFALYDQFISNPHFSVRQEQGQYFIVDEGSTNGTLLNGAQLPPQQPVPLPPDSLIKAGNTQMQFKRLGGETRRMSADAAPPQAGPSGYAPTMQAGEPQPGQDQHGPTQPWNP
ncbi:MAG: FHA domain-containing protein [Anaerolineae bacterium]|nr:FHA domain-containing protein [Anaerolineae bacterium]